MSFKRPLSMVLLSQSSGVLYIYLVKSITLQKALVTNLLVPPGLVFFSVGSHLCKNLLLVGFLVSVYVFLLVNSQP